jgi:hypothetical protein
MVQIGTWSQMGISDDEGQKGSVFVQWHAAHRSRGDDRDIPAEDVKLLDQASDPGVPYPKWMVLQHDTVEDPRLKVLHPELYEDGGPWRNLNREWKG